MTGLHVTLASEPADPLRGSEDFAAATNHSVVLLDGAGVPPGVSIGCRHGVAWFARNLGTRLLAEMATTGSLQACLASAITLTAHSHSEVCDPHGPGAPSATVVAVRVAGDTLEYLVLADSTLLLATADDLHVISDDREALTGRTYRAAMDATANGTPEHEQALTDYVHAMQAHRNRIDGFWVAAGDQEAAKHAITGSVPLQDLQLIALLSDGATRLMDRFGQLTWQAASHLLLQSNGPAELIRRTRGAEASDPAGRRWPRGKSYDDATVAVITTVQCEEPG